MKFFNGIDLQSQKIINLADPSSATDAVTKQYADNLARGARWKDPVRVASTSNINIAAPGSSIDGVTMSSGEAFLAKDQTTGAEKGIYTWNGAATPATRRIDADNGTELAPGTTVYVTEGTTNGDKAFAITSDSAITIGTTSMTWGQIGGGTSYSNGNGLALAGTVFSVQAAASGGISVGAGGVSVDTSIVARKYSANVGNGSLTSIPITHNLGTKDITVSLRATADDSMVMTDWVATDTNTVTLTFAAAPASNAYRVTVTG